MHIGTGIYEGKEINDPISDIPFSPRALTIKEEIFSIISVRVNEATVLDLNDSNGIYGIEALSRGAAVCLFLTPDKKEAAIIKENLDIIGIDPSGLVIADKIKGFLESPTMGQFLTEKYDVIFMQVKEKEEFGLLKSVLEKQKSSGVTAVIFPNRTEFKFPEDIDGCEIVETREFDDKKVVIILKVNL